MAYQVEVYSGACPTCGHGQTWCIVGPDGVALGTSYRDESDADEWCNTLNAAFGRGVEHARRCATLAVYRVESKEIPRPDGTKYHVHTVMKPSGGEIGSFAVWQEAADVAGWLNDARKSALAEASR